MESDLPREQRQAICADVREQLQHMEALITSMLGFVKGGGQEKRTNMMLFGLEPSFLEMTIYSERRIYD